MPDALPSELRVAQAIRDAFAQIKSYLTNLIGEYDAKDGALERDSFNLSRLSALLPQLKGHLEELGFSDIKDVELAELEALYVATIEEINAIPHYGKLGEENISQDWKATSDQALDLVLSGAANETLRLRDDLASQLEAILVRTVMSGATKITDLIDEIQARADMTMNQAITLAATTIHAFSRQMTISAGEETGIEWFLFTGPEDNRTREWCAHFVGTRVTVEILDDYFNQWGHEDQPGPVEAYLGGYNCRHRLVPLAGSFVDKYPEGPTE
jgi:hypothetical protein